MRWRLGRSATFGSDFGGRAWDAPPPRARWRPKRVGRLGEPAGTRTQGPKIKGSKITSGDLPESTNFRTASGTSGPAAVPSPCLPTIAINTSGGRAGDAMRHNRGTISDGDDSLGDAEPRS